MLPKLVRTHAREADTFLAALSAAPSSRSPGLGSGENLRLESETAAGSALVVEDRLLHLVALSA